MNTFLNRLIKDNIMLFSFCNFAVIKAVLSFEEPPLSPLTKEDFLAEINSLFLQLSEPSDVKHQLAAAFIGWSTDTELIIIVFNHVLYCVLWWRVSPPAGSSCGGNCWTQCLVRPWGWEMCLAFRRKKCVLMESTKRWSLMLVRFKRLSNCVAVKNCTQCHWNDLELHLAFWPLSDVAPESLLVTQSQLLLSSYNEALMFVLKVIMSNYGK